MSRNINFFLHLQEAESAPKVHLKLPVTEMADEMMHGARRNSASATPPQQPAAQSAARRTTPSPMPAGQSGQTGQHTAGRQSPNPFLAAAMPTFSANRSSSSILKQVLHEEQRPPNQ